MWDAIAQAVYYVGQNDFCTGVIDMRVESDPAKPGSATVIGYSRGASGHGAWNAESTCTIDFALTYNDAGSIEQNKKQLRIDVPTYPTEVLREEIHPGSGLIALTTGVSFQDVHTYAFIPQYSMGARGYLLVP
ncbi:hypothetical protein [Rhodococcus rhodnii]|uniref:Uncharacterized protein n=1 Tax=Rhodococcus rhodnii LMG 5362 TaxID=1273125 RepID=R7WMI5_9NOCA|nr:hypothetical protein [Rhodococcus rhodnii]EOM76531.1 hypothetical protein Rrhod_2071 [Rhodococcus rhodnii LMG 5362]